MSTFSHGKLESPDQQHQGQTSVLTLDSIPQITLTQAIDNDSTATTISLSPTSDVRRRRRSPVPPPISTGLSAYFSPTATTTNSRTSRSPSDTASSYTAVSSSNNNNNSGSNRNDDDNDNNDNNNKKNGDLDNKPGLPLTRDLLQRKNTLDKLTEQQHSNSFTSPIDERVTMGLGISSASLRQDSTPFLDTTRLDTNSLFFRQPSTKTLQNAASNSPASTNTSPPLSPNQNTLKDKVRRWSFINRKPSTSSFTGSVQSGVSSGYAPLSLYEKHHNHPVPPPPLLSSSQYYHFTSNYPTLHQQQHGKYIQPHYTDHHYMGKKQSHRHHHHHHKRHQRQRQQHASTIPNASLLPPSYYYSHNSLHMPGFSERVLHWLYEAADRVVHVRAPESKLMASLEVDDLLLLSATAEMQEHRQRQEHHTYNEKNNPSGAASPYSPNLNNNNNNNNDSSTTKPVNNLLQGESLRFFSPSVHSFRFNLWKHVIRSRNYELFMLMILIFHWLLLACHPIYVNSQKTMFQGQWHEYTLLLIQIIYTLDCLMKIVVYGLWIPPQNRKSGYQLLFQPFINVITAPWKKPRLEENDDEDDSAMALDVAPTTMIHKLETHHKAFLNSFGNCMDFISLLCYWVDLGIMLYGYPYISIFKALAAARPLRLLSILPGTAVILKSLETGWDLMLDVSGFLFFFMFLFAMVGLISFRGSFSRQCYFFPNGPNQAVLVEPPMSCSGYYNGTTIVGAFDMQTQTHSYPGYQGFLCPHGQQCIADPANNPNNGYMNYDMIFSAFLNVYTFSSMELWTNMMYLTQDAESRMAALYYCVGVYIIGFILVFLLLAVITAAFGRVRATSGSSSAFTRNKASASITSLRHDYILQVLHPGEDVNDVHRRSHHSAMATYEEEQEHQHQHQQQQQLHGVGMNHAPLQRERRRTKARSVLGKWKRWSVNCVQSRAFFYFGGGLVLLDTIFMCFRSVYASESMLEFLDNVETAFTFIFAIEIVVRMMGALNWLQFWSSFQNKFDLALVIVTCVIQLPMIQDHPIYMYLTVFQILRMYRLFLCIPRVERLLAAAMGTGESIINVVIFLLLSTALFSTMFMQLFGGDFGDVMGPDETRLRFDTFWQSYLALIMLYTSEAWVDTLYDTMQSQLYGGAIYAATSMCLYFAFARYIMSGLYIAVILENFDLDDEYIRRYQIKHFIRERMADQKEDTTASYYQSFLQGLLGKAKKKKSETGLTTVEGTKVAGQNKSSASLNIAKLPTFLTASLTKEDMAELLADHEAATSNINNENNGNDANDVDKSEKEMVGLGSPDTEEKRKRRMVPKKVSRFIGNVLFPATDDVHISQLNKGITKSTFVENNDEDYDMMVAEENKKARQADKEKIQPVKSLMFFSERNPVRRFCKRLVGSFRDGQSERQNGFNWFIMACVLISILVVIFNEPSTRKMEEKNFVGDEGVGAFSSVNQKTKVLETLDMVVSMIFVAEMLVRVIADGLLFTRRAYLRHAWNRLDFVVTLLNFVTLFADDATLPRALGTVRSMRVLRLIRYFGGVRDVFIDLFHAFPLMMDAMLLTFIVMIPFSVYGVNIFGGRFWTCNDNNSDAVAAFGRSACVNEFVLNVGADDGYNLNILVPRTWANPTMNLYSFDDFPVSLRHLFSLTSTEGWITSMFYAMSTPPENDMLPTFSWNSPTVYHSIFYVAFMIISHGTVQLFVGVIIEKFKQRSGITTLTFPQRQYVDLQRQLAELKPTIKVFRPSSRLRAWCYDLVYDRRSLFNRWMIVMVFFNMVVISTEFYDEPSWLESFQDYAYLAFALIYTVEVIIKLLGLGRKKWWRTKWNVYDACIAASSTSLVIAKFVAPEIRSLRAERYCLVFAAFRIGEGFDSLQTLYHTIGMAMPSIIRVSAVFMLVMCLFAMIFMEFFGLTKYGPSGSDNSNFRTYGNALLLLVRMTTGEGWNEVMMDYTYSAPNCVSSPNYLEDDCGSANWAYFLFNLFYITCTHIFLNLFIAVIIANFEYAYETRTRFTGITKSDLRKFKYAWAEVDPEGTGFICKEKVAKFFKHLTGRFQVGIYDQVHSIKHLQKLSRVNLNNNSVASPLPPPSSPSRLSYQELSSPMANEKDLRANYSTTDYNYKKVNQCLSSLDPSELEKRRKYYNLLYMEIVDAETSKGIAFSDVLRIMAFRFVDIEQALTLHPLMERLEKLDRFNKTYAANKGRGAFLKLIERKRYLQALWQKRNQTEFQLEMASGLAFSPFPRRLDPPSVPTITIEDVVQIDLPSPTKPGSFLSPVSYSGVDPTSGLSLEIQHSTMPASPPYRPFNEEQPRSGPASPLFPQASPSQGMFVMSPRSTNSGSTNSNTASPVGSPLPSPIIGQHPPSWLFMDANTSLSVDQAESVMSSLDTSAWSSILHEHISPE